MEELRCIVSTPSLEVYLDVAQGWLYTRWLGVHTKASIKEALAAVCVHLRGHSYTKILSDHSSLIGNWPEESPWEMRAYFDVLAAHGITYFAWVYNQSHYNRTLMEQTLYSIERPAVAAFKDVASAYEWLCRCATSSLVNLGEYGGTDQSSLFS